jgi:hypothetical protein
MRVRPVTPGTVESSSRDTPYFQYRSVARTAHSSSPMPTIGKRSARRAAGLSSWIAARTARNAVGKLIKFQNAAKIHAVNMVARLESMIRPAAQSARHSQGESG